MPYPANFHNQEEAPESVRPADSLSVATPCSPPSYEGGPAHNASRSDSGGGREGVDILIETVKNPIWVSVSEAARLGGVQAKTIRRAIESKKIVFKVKDNRYCIEIGSVFQWLLSSPKSKKKFLDNGIIQYFKK